MRLAWIVSLGVSLFLTACSLPFISSSTKAPVIEELTQTPVSKIIISELDILDRPYTILGDVYAKESSWIPMKSPSTEALNARLQEEAYRLHADAIIFVSYKTDKATWHSMEATGKAVKFRY